MKFAIIFPNRRVKVFSLISIFLVILYIILRLIFFENDPLLPLLDLFYKIYLIVPEKMANVAFNLTHAGVLLKDHQLIFKSESFYHLEYSNFIENWTRYLLYKRFSGLIILLIWVNFSRLRNKIVFTLIFVFVHIISVAGGLFLLGGILPNIVDENTSFDVSPTIVGTFFMYILILAWLLFNKQEIRNTFKKLNINIEFSDKKLYEVVILLFFFLIIRNYIIPFYAFKNYVIFLLEITRLLSSIFGFDGYIIGDQLRGDNGALALSKHCLGFMTMYLFSSMVYLTRPKNNPKSTWIYISFGLIIVFSLNVIRLVSVFIIAQGDNGFERANRHHEIYNIGIYFVIFILWVIWFEFLRKSILAKADKDRKA